MCIYIHINIYVYLNAGNVYSDLKPERSAWGPQSRGGGEPSRTVKINANIQLGVSGMKEGGRNEERNVAEY